jgi:hypothetical protein
MAVFTLCPIFNGQAAALQQAAHGILGTAAQDGEEARKQSDVLNSKPFASPDVTQNSVKEEYLELPLDFLTPESGTARLFRAVGKQLSAYAASI